MSRAWLSGGVLAVVLAVFSSAWVPARASEAGPEATAAEEKDDIFKGGAEIAIWTLVVFGLLLFVLGKYAWPQVLAGLDKREQTIAHAMEEAKRAQEEAQKLTAELQKQREAAAGQARAVVEEARRNGQQLVDDMKSKAQVEIQADRDRLRREIQVAHDQALSDLWKQTSEVATLVSAKAIRRQLTEEDHRRLVDEALAELGSAAQERQRVLTGLA